MYNAFYNVLALLLPLITTPYISRVMGAKNIGIYSYSYSIVFYFGLFILLGLNNYGNRTIAQVRGNKKRDVKKLYIYLFYATIVWTFCPRSVFNLLHIYFIR
ncbi:MAG: oligosaccharide flippase family protein [Thomasclavelia sp.]